MSPTFNMADALRAFGKGGNVFIVLFPVGFLAGPLYSFDVSMDGVKWMDAKSLNTWNTTNGTNIAVNSLFTLFPYIRIKSDSTVAADTSFDLLVAHTVGGSILQ